MNTTSIGQEGERRVAEYLISGGYELIEHNWRTKMCEIDLIMKKGKKVYFVEVKYRSGALQGSGLEYITPKKTKQMRFAAELWMLENKWKGDAILMGAEVGPEGDPYVVEID